MVVRERASKRVSAAERAREASSASKRTSERREQTSERTSEWSSNSVYILSCSGPQCIVALLLPIHSSVDGRFGQGVGHLVRMQLKQKIANELLILVRHVERL